MFRLFIILSCLFSYQVNADEIKNKIYDSAGTKISEKVSDLIPGDGITEVSLEKRSSEDFNFSILGVRDIFYNNNLINTLCIYINLWILLYFNQNIDKFKLLN